jgi:predicted negative regulator of RcsB-dependent stress response
MSSEILKKNFQTRLSNFIKKNKKYFVYTSIIIFFLILAFLFIQNLKKKNEIKISEEYTQATILIKQKKLQESKLILESIINKEHEFYSPLALYLIIDNNIEDDYSKVIDFFDIILKNSSIDKEILNLIKIKKTIYLLNQDDENLIIATLNPVINSDSIWRNMAIDIIVEYFLSRNQKIRANEYIQLLDNKINK